MSPTSYQAAPPREFIIADAQKGVKRIREVSASNAVPVRA
jgi:hypothetical protein